MLLARALNELARGVSSVNPRPAPASAFPSSRSARALDPETETIPFMNSLRTALE